MLVDIGTGDEIQLRIRARRMDVQLAGSIGRIGTPSNFVGGVEHGKPGEASMRAHTVIDKAKLAIAPGAKHHSAGRVCVDYTVGPTWRHDHLVALAGKHGNTGPRIVVRTPLSIDDSFAFKDFK